MPPEEYHLEIVSVNGRTNWPEGYKSTVNKHVLFGDHKTHMSRFDASVRASSCENLDETIGMTVETNV